MFSRLRADFPSLRFNWSLVDSPELYLSQDKQITELDPTITADNAGQTLWLPVERQTLCRLTVSPGDFVYHSHAYLSAGAGNTVC
ncbi:MAG: heme-dependent oxidative N-demethylase subunit alpha family protein [Phormidesmis sp.]